MSYAVVNDGAGGCRKNHGISRTRGDEAASAGLGFIQGESVRVVGENPGGMILMVKGVKIALNRALANRIMVEN